MSNHMAEALKEIFDADDSGCSRNVYAAIDHARAALAKAGL
jgi:hypothetical protein